MRDKAIFVAQVFAIAAGAYLFIIVILSFGGTQ